MPVDALVSVDWGNLGSPASGVLVIGIMNVIDVRQCSPVFSSDSRA